MLDTKQYFEIIEAFNNSKLPYEGTHSLMNFVCENYPEEVEYVTAVMNLIGE